MRLTLYCFDNFSPMRSSVVSSPFHAHRAPGGGSQAELESMYAGPSCRIIVPATKKRHDGPFTGTSQARGTIAPLAQSTTEVGLAYVSVPIVFTNSRANWKSLAGEITNLFAIKTCPEFSLSTISWSSETGDRQLSNGFIFFQNRRS
jgi:hypothetical protein